MTPHEIMEKPLSDGVLYLLVGAKHAANLIVSVHSLRKHFKGPVHIICESHGPGYECVMNLWADQRLHPVSYLATDEVGADAVVPWRGDGKIHLTKTRLPEMTPFERTAFLDCDTLVTGPIDELFPTRNEVVLTGFQWRTQGKKLRGRIETWREYWPALVDRAIALDGPHINTGVMGFSKTPACAKFAEQWHATAKVNGHFTDDELAAQLIAPDHGRRHLDGRFNRSSNYQGMAEDVRVWHFHHRMNYRDGLGKQIWLPAYLECLEQNIANIRRWPIHRYNWRSLSDEWKCKFRKIDGLRRSIDTAGNTEPV